MNIYKAILIILCSFALSSRAQKVGYNIDQLTDQEYIVKEVNGGLLWSEANVIDDFCYPWRDELPPATSFKALYDSEFFISSIR